MQTLLIISIIVLILTLVYIVVQKEKISHLVEDNENLKNTIGSIRTNFEVEQKNLRERLELALTTAKQFEGKSLFILSRLTDISRNWNKRLTFFNPDAYTPTLLMKYNHDSLCYEFFRVGTKTPVELGCDFVFGNKKLTEIIGEFEKSSSSL